MKRIIILISLLLFINTLSGQEVTFNSLLNAVNEPENNKIQKELLENGFTMISPYNGLLEPEKWAYDYNPGSTIARIWIYIVYNSVEYKKNIKSTTIRVHTYGAENPLLQYLTSKIKKNCTYERTFFHSTHDYYSNDYKHKSGATFSIYSVKGEYVIKAYNSQKNNSNTN